MRVRSLLVVVVALTACAGGADSTPSASPTAALPSQPALGAFSGDLVDGDAEAQVLPGVTHDGITDPVAAPEIVDLIVEALESV